MYRVCLCVSIMYVVKKTFNGFSFLFFFFLLRKAFSCMCVSVCVDVCVWLC